MATVTSVVTIDTGEWVYPDVYGVGHTVTNAQTFNLTIENTASNIKWQILPTGVAQTVTTTDGYTLTFRGSADGKNSAYQLMVMALADSTLSYNVAGELRIECPVSGIVQVWKPAQFYTSNVDMNAAGVLGGNTALTQCLFEDQFGNTMRMPAGLVAGITVGQAA